MAAKKIVISCFILIFILGMMSACGLDLDEEFEENLENEEQLKENDEEENEESKEVDNEKEPEEKNEVNDKGDNDDNDKLKTIIEEEKYFIYTVQKGDTLFEIAMENDTTVDTLVNLNDLDNKSLYPDQELKIPEVN